MGSPRAAVCLAAVLLAAAGSAGSATPPFRPTGGLTFGPAAPTGVGPQGDTTIAAGDGGTVYAAAEDSGSGIGVALSTDGGATWTSTRFFVPGELDGRISLAVDRGGAPSPADDTIFLVAHFDGGAYLFSSPGGVLDFVNAAGGQQIGTGACGALVFDRVQRNLYLPCATGSRVRGVTRRVAPGQPVRA